MTQRVLRSIPDKTPCSWCEHKAAYHGGPQCLGAVGFPIGFFNEARGDKRCPCTHKTDEIREAAR